MRKMMMWMVVIICAVAAVNTQAGTLIISQYYEGASYDKWVEIYNATDAAVDLGTAGYRLGLWSNASRELWKSGTAASASVALTGTLPAGGSLLVSHTSAALPSYATADIQNASVCNFNGDDSVILYTGETYDFANVVDAFGITNATTVAANLSFVRTNTLTDGVNTDFDAVEWIQFSNAEVDAAAESTNERLGYHSISGVAPVVSTNVKFTASAAAVDEDAGTYEITVIKTLAEGNVSGQIELGGTAAEGPDYSLSGTNFTMNGTTTSATFTVTITDDLEQEGAETITLTLANVVGGTPASPTVFTLTINANDFGASSVIISQYTETDSGTIPKGIEIWNVSGGDITFDDGANKLEVYKGVNGGALAIDFTLTNGTLVAGDVLVVGTSDMIPDVEKAFTFSGNDALSLELGGVLQDVFGTPGVDPGVAWTNNGISSKDQNIQLKDGITDGDKDGWTDPSERFELVAVGSDLTGFGVAPGGAPQTNVKFTASAASVSEGVGTYDVIIVKTLAEGTVSGTIELAGTATEGVAEDYTVSSTNFTLDGAITSATITITVNDDAIEEVAETVILTLANVTGGTVVSPSVFTLTIAANDAPPQGILSFRFTADPFLQVTTKDSNLTVSDMALSAGEIETDKTYSYFTNSPCIEETGGWSEPDQATAKNFTFSLEPAPGYAVAVTGISFSAYRTSAGPGTLGFDIRSGTSTYAADFPSAELVEVNQAVTGITGEESSMTVLIQGWTNAVLGTSGGGIFRLDDVVIWGTVTPTGSGPTQPDITGFEVPAGASASVTLLSVNGQTYNLEYTVDPTATPVVWTAADTVAGDGNEITLSDADPADVMRIYRVTTE